MENLNIDTTPPSVSPTPAMSASRNGTATAEPAPSKPEPPKPLSATADAASTPHAMPQAAAAAPARSNSFAMLAGAVAVAGAFGSLAGAFAATGFANWSTPAHLAAAPGQPSDLRSVQATIEQVRTELGTLRTHIETGAKTTNAQFGKITERFDRVERAQAERSAKLAKATESLERLEKRADATPNRDITGSVPLPTPAPGPAVAANPPAPVVHAPATKPSEQASVPGWSVRDVYRGIALIQSPRTGMMEVEAGDTVPNLGRVESIRRQDGRWVVVTSKGIIAGAR